MKIEISVRRQKSRDEKPYIQKFHYTGDGNLTVADWLREVNQTETKADRIAWECGCLEKKCGACAILVNGSPVLACSVFLKKAVKRGKIILEPFQKFPLIKDLVVDRSSVFDAIKHMKVIIPGIVSCSTKQVNVYNVDVVLKYVLIFWQEMSSSERLLW